MNASKSRNLRLTKANTDPPESAMCPFCRVSLIYVKRYEWCCPSCYAFSRHDPFLPVPNLLRRAWMRLRRLTLVLVLVLVAAAMLLLPALGGRARAQSPDQVVATTQAVGGNLAPCLLALENRETGGTYSATALNPNSFAYGPLQFLQSGGIWDESPLGQAGVPVTVTSVAEQVAAGVWAIASGHLSAWNPSPAECVGMG